MHSQLSLFSFQRPSLFPVTQSVEKKPVVEKVSQVERDLVLIPNITIHPDKICLYKVPHWHPSAPPKRSQEEIKAYNQWKAASIIGSERSAKGRVSDIARRKMSKAITYLVTMSRQKQSHSRFSGRYLQFRLAFITLTLPSPQVHDDNQIKSECLNQFIIEVKRFYKVKHYVWRAEKQKNGNIHFHILVDKFIPWQEIRDRWNRIINKLGYVDSYRESQKDWHKDGFRHRPELLKTWSYEKQYKAYTRGAKSHWNSPNSTDVHAIKKINNVKAYVQKYAVKDETSIPNLEKKINQLQNELSKNIRVTAKKKTIRTLRKLQLKLKRAEKKELVLGRIWGCDRELSNVEGFRGDIDSEMENELKQAVDQSDSYHHHDKYFDIFYINFDDLPKYGADNLFKYFCNYLYQKFGYAHQTSSSL